MDATLALTAPQASAGRGGADALSGRSGADDGSLAARTLAGDVDAYAELVRRHQTVVYNVAFRLVGERQTALDLAQDAFVRAYRALATFDQVRPFGPWIARVAASVALDWLERKRVPTVPLPRPPGRADGEPGEEALPDESAEPERLYLEAEEREAIRRAILALPPHYRAVVELRHFQELTYDEIASTLGIPLSDVKSHLFRARRLLRRSLGARVREESE